MAESKMNGAPETNPLNADRQKSREQVTGLLQANFSARPNEFLESALQDSSLTTRNFDVHSSLAVSDSEAVITGFFAHADPEMINLTEKNRLSTAEAASMVIGDIGS